MLQAGLRVAKAANLRMADLVLRERAGSVRIRRGKGRRERGFPFLHGEGGDTASPAAGVVVHPHAIDTYRLTIGHIEIRTGITKRVSQLRR